MKKQTIYTCETCGCFFKNEQDCLDCENKHLKIKGVEPKYWSLNPYDNECGVSSEEPQYIVVTLSDGVERKYQIIGEGN